MGILLSFLSDAVDQPFGPDAVGGFALIAGLSPFVVFILALSGGWCINMISFYVSRRYMSKRIVDSCSTREYGNYCRWFWKYGKWSLLFSALVFPYIIFIWISGAFQMKFRDFFIFGMIPRGVRIAFVIFLVAGILHVSGL